MESMRAGVCLAQFVAKVCMLQLEAGKHFLVESPAGSELFWLQCFERIWNLGAVVQINVPQCEMGLKVNGEPISKNTTLMASVLT